MAQDDEIKVPLMEWNQLIELITQQNKNHDDSHTDILNQIKEMNAEHEKRYNELFRLINRIMAGLKKSVREHGKRITELEERVDILEETLITKKA